MRKCFCGVLAAVLLLALAGCSPAEEQLTVLTIGTADSGGTMYPVGASIAQTLSGDRLKINVGASTGSTMNIKNLQNGAVDLALVSGDAAMEELAQNEDSGLRAVAAVFTSMSGWMAPVCGGAEYVHDLQGKHIGIGPESSATEMAARVSIKTLGLEENGGTWENCALGTGAEKVISGEMDAIHAFAGIPVEGLAQLAQAYPCRLLTYTEEELGSILAENPIYIRTAIPANTYKGQTEPVETFGVKCLLCVDARMDEELVYEITRALWENRERLAQSHPAMRQMESPVFLYEELPIPLHEGAAGFYNEQTE